MTRKPFRRMLPILVVILFTCALPFHALSQTANRPNPYLKQPLSLAHLYWHFLTYQNFLDQTAAAKEAQGKDGTWLRTHLQK